MLDRIIAQFALALFSYLERRMERSTVAVDADPNRDLLRRAGSRLRLWMRREDDLRTRGKSDAGGAVKPVESLPPGERRVDPKQQLDQHS